MSFLKKISWIFFFVVAYANASIDSEMEGMDVVSRDDGTFLIGSPTYFFDRALGSAGVHSESEIWTPKKLRMRLLFNRLSVLPSWNPLEPSIWMKTGNELGDMLYQDVITPENRPDNRTPILEGGFRTPSFKGFWATARAFQDDHYSSRTSGVRAKIVDDYFSLFGENYPMFSSAYAGFGYTNDFVNSSILVGEEYMWLFGESSRWIPVHYKPRIESRIDVSNLYVTLGYEHVEYENYSAKGSRKEVSGSAYYQCGKFCDDGILQYSVGSVFRVVDDSGSVYSGLQDNYVVWPFVEFQLTPINRLKINAMFGINDENWLVEDSVEYSIPITDGSKVVVGVKNVSGTRLNPIADDEEYFDDYTISLSANGTMNVVQGYVDVADSLQFVGIGGRATYWAEYGAETFSTTELKENEKLIYRKGDVVRVNSWIQGFSGELWLGAWYNDLVSFKALGGFEHLEGAEHRFEVTPVEYFVSFSADWLLYKSFRISHSIRYRSDAEWNLRSSDLMEIKGDWFWDATFEQMFPKYKLYLTGSILHTLANEVVQTPNGNVDRIRFVCTIRKMF